MNNAAKKALYKKFIIPMIPTIAMVFLIGFLLLIVMGAFGYEENEKKNTETTSKGCSTEDCYNSHLELPYAQVTYLTTCLMWCYENHRGMDFVSITDKKIYSGGNGTVYLISENCAQDGEIGNYCGGGYGNHIVVSYIIDDVIYYVTYAHMLNVNQDLVKGDKVNRNTILGYQGLSGNTSGPHLHVDIRAREYSANALKETYTVFDDIFVERNENVEDI